MSQTVEVSTVVILAEVLSAARQARLEGCSSHPKTVLNYLRRVHPALEEYEMYAALAPEVSDPQERQVLDWFCNTRRRGQLVMTMGNEYTILQKLWRRLITDAVPPISPEEQRDHNNAQLRRLHTGRF